MRKNSAKYNDAYAAMTKRQLFNLAVRFFMNTQLISREDAHYKIYEIGRESLTSQQRTKRELIK